ncbi:hypothetical protein ACFSQE_01810 [Vogesella fluminis]|uniref:Transposase n=1 Tax=Vogesella fluminis TaxID=1069161 RepID=A0ABQ3H794_9NEIS|nr:hypothetical protein [Vogesella fluminis]GHD70683.1 hypothetical protein GCM10011419_01420 [Vogesella fluminis]
MLKPDRLDRFLPQVFPSGVKVSSFAKHCPHCKKLVKSAAMHGVALMVVDRVFILARAECPQCGSRFEVKCMFDDSKQVHPVLLPTLMVRWLMQWHAYQLRRRGIPLKPLVTVVGDEQQDAVTTQERVGLLLADSEVTKSPEMVGSYLGLPIVAWIEYQGLRYNYDRAVPEEGQFRLGQYEALFDRRLIYRRSGH